MGTGGGVESDDSAESNGAVESDGSAEMSAGVGRGVVASGAGCMTIRNGLSNLELREGYVVWKGYIGASFRRTALSSRVDIDSSCELGASDKRGARGQGGQA